MIRDKRKIDTSGQPRAAGNPPAESAPAPDSTNTSEQTEPAGPTAGPGTPGAAAADQPGPAEPAERAGTAVEPAPSDRAAAAPADAAPDASTVGQPPASAEGASAEGASAEGASAEGASIEAPPSSQSAAGETDAATATSAPPALGAELEALRTELDERVRDLQRLGAEYSNYRKRVERDRSAVVEQAVGMVISSLLPILDDIDRARDHDDLVGPFATVAEQLSAALAKFGLSGFGEAGDAFDPTRHEAVAHQTSPDVTEPTCVTVMRRGYLLGDRLLRAAMVAVADPQ